MQTLVLTALQLVDGDYQLSFEHTFENQHDTTYFAFCYPKSYTEVQNALDAIERQYGNHCQAGTGTVPITRAASLISFGMAPKLSHTLNTCVQFQRFRLPKMRFTSAGSCSCGRWMAFAWTCSRYDTADSTGSVPKVHHV